MSTEKRVRILSGIQPSGKLHLGNYFGMMRPALELQEQGDAFLFIANYHALTTVTDPALLRRATLDVALDFLAHFGLVERQGRPGGPGAPQTRVELLRTVVVRTPEFRFARPVVGFETFDEGELIATDGDEEIRAPCPRCTILMPARQPVPGREGVYLARPLD